MDGKRNITGHIEGEPSKRYKIFTSDIDGNPHELKGEFDTIEELNNFPRRLDKRYIVYDGRNRINPQ